MMQATAKPFVVKPREIVDVARKQHASLLRRVEKLLIVGKMEPLL